MTRPSNALALPFALGLRLLGLFGIPHDGSTCFEETDLIVVAHLSRSPLSLGRSVIESVHVSSPYDASSQRSNSRSSIRPGIGRQIAERDRIRKASSILDESSCTSI